MIQACYNQRFAFQHGKYVGEWKNDKRDGQGTYSAPNGDTYSGGWYRDEEHGEGTFTFKTGSSYKGLWENGRKIKVF